jgi:hypothetical protein
MVLALAQRGKSRSSPFCASVRHRRVNATAGTTVIAAATMMNAHGSMLIPFERAVSPGCRTYASKHAPVHAWNPLQRALLVVLRWGI